MAAEFVKREREVNWSQEEKDCFREILSKHLHVIDDKGNDTKLISKKKEAWRIIKSDMESLGYAREVNKMKQQWMRMKAHTKKSLSAVRKAREATGNCVEVPQLSYSDEEVAEMIQTELEEDNALIDSNTEPLHVEQLQVSLVKSHPEHQPIEADQQPICSKQSGQGGDNLLDDLRNMPKRSEKHDVLSERRKQIMHETRQSEEMHLLKIRHEKEIHALQVKHMIELQKLKKQLIEEQILRVQSNEQGDPLEYLD